MPLNWAESVKKSNFPKPEFISGLKRNKYQPSNEDLTPKNNSIPINKSDKKVCFMIWHIIKIKKHMRQTQHQKTEKTKNKIESR